MLLSGKEFRGRGRRLYWETADRLVLVEGGGCAWVVIGAAMVAAGFYCILAGNMSDMVLPEWLDVTYFLGFKAAVVLGWSLGLAGLGLLTWRVRTVFDRKTDIWVRRSSVLYVLGLTKRGKVHDLEAVHIERQGKPRYPSNWSQFPVFLRARLEEGGTVEFHLGTWSNEQKAQEAAAAVRDFFNLPVLDEV